MEGIVVSDELRRWFRARTLFLGNGPCVRIDRPAGLRLAADCPNIEDAHWLCSLFAHDDIGTWPAIGPADLADRFEGGEQDARSLCFSALIRGHFYATDTRLVLAAAMGYPLAQALSSFFYNIADEVLWEYTRNAAKHFEPHALFRMAMGLRGFEFAGNHMLPYLKLAAELGHHDAIYHYATRAFYTWEPAAYVWLDKCACLRYRASAATTWMAECVRFLANGHQDHSAAVYTIGRLLKSAGLAGLPKYYAFTYHGQGFHACEKAKIHRLLWAVDLFDRESTSTRKAVEAWLIVARRLRVGKDMRRVIGELVWAQRGVDVPLKPAKRTRKKRK